VSFDQSPVGTQIAQIQDIGYWIIGGQTNIGLLIKYTYVFTLVGSWNPGPALKDYIYDTCAVDLSPAKGMVLGGTNAASGEVNTVWIYDFITEQWTIGTPMTLESVAAGPVVQANSIW
jgi:hypothetical protein